MGLITGSFANVLIYRIPRGQGIVWERSACPSCGGKIAWFDLIPVVSFLILRARCRHCRAPISWLYPAVELYSGVIFLLAYDAMPSIGLVGWLFSVFILESLLVLSVIDFKNFILPDSIMLVMLVGIIVYGFFERMHGGQAFNIFSSGNFIGAVILFSGLFILWLLSRGTWLGLGDAKMASLIGLIFGLWGGLVVFYGAIVVGVIVSVILLVSHGANLKTKLPLGTLIGFSATVYLFLGQNILDKIKPFFFSVPYILR